LALNEQITSKKIFNAEAIVDAATASVIIDLTSLGHVPKWDLQITGKVVQVAAGDRDLKVEFFSSPNGADWSATADQTIADWAASPGDTDNFYVVSLSNVKKQQFLKVLLTGNAGVNAAVTMWLTY